jgi:hypothetical protein
VDAAAQGKVPGLRMVRLDSLTHEQRRLVMALIAAASSPPAGQG